MPMMAMTTRISTRVNPRESGMWAVWWRGTRRPQNDEKGMPDNRASPRSNRSRLLKRRAGAFRNRLARRVEVDGARRRRREAALTGRANVDGVGSRVVGARALGAVAIRGDVLRT